MGVAVRISPSSHLTFIYEIDFGFNIETQRSKLIDQNLDYLYVAIRSRMHQRRTPKVVSGIDDVESIWDQGLDRVSMAIHSRKHQSRHPNVVSGIDVGFCF